MPILRMKVAQSAQRWSPNALVPQAAHSYTVIGRRGIPGAGTTTGMTAGWRRRQAFLRQ
jgi:hypothetical protein